MSGDLACPGLELLHLDLESLELSDAVHFNPLHCLLCQQLLHEPCSFRCRHIFCLKCVNERRNGAEKLNCPLCGICTDWGENGPRPDHLMKFFVDSASEHADLCANCELASQPMYFCETCHQPLCMECKESTHQARMFSFHKIVLLEERTGFGLSRKCLEHDEPFILFSNESKSLKCINCFRQASLELRSHFVDVAVAHEAGCHKLDDLGKNLKGFQRELSDTILLHRSLLEEVSRSATVEKAGVQQFCQQILDKLLETRDTLLNQIDMEFNEREKHFKSNLKQLCALVPTVQLYLLITSIFSSSASQMDFLEFGYMLISRVQAIITENQDKRPQFTSQIQTFFRQEFSKALEQYIAPGVAGRPIWFQPQLSNHDSNGRNLFHASSNGEISPASSVGSAQYARGKRGSRSFAATPAIQLSGAFAEHFCKLDERCKELNARFSKLRRNAQEIQRDLTMRRCLINVDEVKAVLEECDAFEKELSAHTASIDECQPLFQQLWEEELGRIRQQQEIFQSHMMQLMNLRDDLGKITAVASKMEPFICSITSAIHAVAPKRLAEEEIGPMAEICLQISTLEPNSQSRIDAIEREEERRKATTAANKGVDESLMQQKRKLRRSTTERRRECITSVSVVKGVDRERGLLSPPLRSRNQQRNSNPSSPGSSMSVASTVEISK